MYSVTPKKQNKLTAFACAACFVCGIGLFALTLGQAAVPFAKLALQLIAVLLLGAGIYLYTRYFAHQLTYAVSPGGVFDADGREVYDLTVIDTVGGKKQRVLCRISLRDVVQADARPARTTKKNGYPVIEPTSDQGQVFRYCTDMVPERILAIYDRDGNVVILTYDQTLYEILKRK